jgi:hypothetical protein
LLPAPDAATQLSGALQFDLCSKVVLGGGVLGAALRMLFECFRAWSAVVVVLPHDKSLSRLCESTALQELHLHDDSCSAAALPFMLCSLSQASVNGHIKVVEQLLSAGADPLAQNKEQRTAVDMAKTPELAQLLQAHKASS